MLSDFARKSKDVSTKNMALIRPFSKRAFSVACSVRLTSSIFQGATPNHPMTIHMPHPGFTERCALWSTLDAC